MDYLQSFLRQCHQLCCSKTFVDPPFLDISIAGISNVICFGNDAYDAYVIKRVEERNLRAFDRGHEQFDMEQEEDDSMEGTMFYVGSAVPEPEFVKGYLRCLENSFWGFHLWDVCGSVPPPLYEGLIETGRMELIDVTGLRLKGAEVHRRPVIDIAFLVEMEDL